MSLYETDSYHYTSVAADFGAQERRMVQPSTGYICGPYLPYSSEEMAKLETDMFGAKLSDFEKIVLEGAHQYRIRAVAYRHIGETAAADTLEGYADSTLANLKRAVARDDPERIYLSS